MLSACALKNKNNTEKNKKSDALVDVHRLFVYLVVYRSRSDRVVDVCWIVHSIKWIIMKKMGSSTFSLYVDPFSFLFDLIK